MSADEHDHGLQVWSVLLLIWAFIEVFSPASTDDSLVKANGAHDAFDFAFVLVLFSGPSLQRLFPGFHLCNLGPVLIIAGTIAGLGFLIVEVVNHPGGEAAKNGWSVVMLLVSAVLSYKVLTSSASLRRPNQELTPKARLRRFILRWHFLADVVSTSIGALIAALNLYWQLADLRTIAAWLILAVTAAVAYKIWRLARQLVHKVENCKEQPRP